MHEQSPSASSFEKKSAEIVHVSLSRPWWKELIIFLGFLLLFVGVFFIGHYQGQQDVLRGTHSNVPLFLAVFDEKEPPIAEKNTVDFTRFWRAMEILREKYVGSKDVLAADLVSGAIKGMYAATGDPYTTYFTPEEYQSFVEDFDGEFEGIGAEIGMREGRPIIVAPLAGSPAAKAGLLPQDSILSIDKEGTDGMSLEEVVKHIRGKKGTVVTLTIYRQGEDDPRDITVTRDRIEIKSVTAEVKDGVGHVIIARFEEDVLTELPTTLKKMQEAGVTGIILDLRSNPGGRLDVVVKNASLFLSKGSVVAIEEDGSGRRKELRTTGDSLYEKIPLVILVNGGSASASEIFAAAVSYHRPDVRLVGTKTFGKGSVQELIPMGAEGAVKITVAKWLTPSGEHIDKVGIIPHVDVKMTSEDVKNHKDPQWDAARDLLLKNIEK